MLGCSLLYNYIILYVLLVLVEGRRHRHHVGSELYYFSSNPGRLVEVLLRVLVGYLHDGKTFDAEAYHNSV